MPRTCESIARLKIEDKQRTKCCNLQHFALSDGKNLRKYHSFSPRKWLKYCYLQGFVRVTIFDFLKNERFFAFIKTKNGSKSAKHAEIYRGLAPSRAKNCVNTSVSASKSVQLRTSHKIELMKVRKPGVSLLLHHKLSKPAETSPPPQTNTTHLRDGRAAKAAPCHCLTSLSAWLRSKLQTCAALASIANIGPPKLASTARIGPPKRPRRHRQTPPT